jgi:hypothetical protein
MRQAVTFARALGKNDLKISSIDSGRWAIGWNSNAEGIADEGGLVGERVPIRAIVCETSLCRHRYQSTCDGDFDRQVHGRFVAVRG